jgi:hypothetical protein
VSNHLVQIEDSTAYRLAIGQVSGRDQQHDVFWIEERQEVVSPLPMNHHVVWRAQGEATPNRPLPYGATERLKGGPAQGFDVVG